MREYDAKTLRKLQLKELDIYEDFRTLCQKYGIPFFAFCGTAIGAMRHQGFIPWDDDIDVGFLRADYERFMSAALRELSDRYELVSARTHTHYPLMTTRMCIKGTRFVEEALDGIDCPLGIFLDIYALDAVAADDKAMRKQIRHAWFWSKLAILKEMPAPLIPLEGLMHRAAALACRVIHWGLNITRVSKRWIVRRYEYWATLYNGQDTGRYADLSDTMPSKLLITREELFPLKEVPFEDITIPLPNDVDAHLKRYYGDYMKLPPPEKRKNHYPAHLDFGDGDAE